MKRNGQVLALFIIIIPILLIMFLFTIELGTNYYNKRKMESISKNVIKYYLDNSSMSDIETKLDNLIIRNINNLKSKNIYVSNDYIKIEMEYEYKTILSGFTKSKKYNIKTSYIGYYSNNKQIIEKESRDTYGR